MKSLNQEIFHYVDSKSGSWSNSSISTNYSKLCTIDSISWEPGKLYQELSTKGYANYTIQTYFVLAKKYEETIKKTYKFKKWIEDNRLKFKNCYKEKTRRLSDPEYQTLLKSAPSNDLYNFLLLCGHFGLRKSEALAAKWSDFESGRFCVKNGKGNKQRLLPKQFSRNILKNQDIGDGAIISPLLTNIMVANYIKPYTPHDFRHYAVTNWINRDKLNMKQAAILAGHASILTTARYVRTDLNEIEEKLG